MWFWSTNIYFKFGSKPKSVAPPDLPPPVKTPSEISIQAAKAGETGGRRFRKKRGRFGTRITKPELAGVPAPIVRAGLTTLG